MDRYKFVKTKNNIHETVNWPIVKESNDDIYINTRYNDRLDFLAWKYYKDVSLWWIISQANENIIKDSMFLEPGLRIRIPYGSGISKYLKEIKNT